MIFILFSGDGDLHLLARVLHLVVGESCGRSVVVFLDPLVCIVGMVVKKGGVCYRRWVVFSRNTRKEIKIPVQKSVFCRKKYY